MSNVQFFQVRSLLRQVVLFPIYILNFCVSAIEKLYEILRPSLLNELQSVRYNKFQKLTKSVVHYSSQKGKSYSFQLFAPNAMCRFRAHTFSSKEPETLAWIEALGGEGAFFDIGANVGLYSTYYALVNSGAVYSFEPSVFNLRLLAQNSHLNGLQHRINIIPNPLSNQMGFEEFKMQNTDEGGALSSFGVDYGHTGETLKTNFSFRSCGFTLDFLMDSNIIREIPRMIKIDVDGIEHLILEGAQKALKHPKCISVLIEVDKKFHLAADRVKILLVEAGFSLLKKDEWGQFGGGEVFESSPNQIWVKPNLN